MTTRVNQVTKFDDHRKKKEFVSKKKLFQLVSPAHRSLNSVQPRPSARAVITKQVNRLATSSSPARHTMAAPTALPVSLQASFLRNFSAIFPGHKTLLLFY